MTSVTYFGPIRVDGLPLEALDIVDGADGADDALAYVKETEYAPPAEVADDDQAAIEAAIAEEVWGRV